MKTDLIRTERHLLKEMGFICHVEHPHKFILNYLLQLEAPPELMQEAWNLANDRYRLQTRLFFSMSWCRGKSLLVKYTGCQNGASCLFTCGWGS